LDIEFPGLTKAHGMIEIPVIVDGSFFMDSDFCRKQALRARDLAEKGDQFTRKRLLALADRYDAQAGGLPRSLRMTERPAPLPRERPISS
jgi:hypothetical protein